MDELTFRRVYDVSTVAVRFHAIEQRGHECGLNSRLQVLSFAAMRSCKIIIVSLKLHGIKGFNTLRRQHLLSSQ